MMVKLKEYVIIKIMIYILENGFKKNLVEMVYIYLLMEKSIKDNLKMEIETDLENTFIKMEICMKVNGQII